MSQLDTPQNMTKISVSEAARLYGKDRKTLYRHINKGRLSAGPVEDGVRLIDMSELIRVYGEPPASNATGATPPSEDVATPSSQALMDEILALRKEVQGLRDEIKRLPPPKPEKTTVWQRIKSVFKPDD